MTTINKLVAREVLDSRGFPTVEAEVFLHDTRRPGESVFGRAMVPSGASTGEGEALELRDGDMKRFQGKGCLKAVDNIRTRIAPKVIGHSFESQAKLDETLCLLDGTKNKTELGANAILAVSMAYLRASAAAQGLPAYRQIASEGQLGSNGVTLPVPLMNILNGGKHADNGLDIQEFMIVPAGFTRFSDALRAGTEVFHRLKKILHAQGLSTGVGDEGGFAPVFKGEKPHEQAIRAILQAIGDAGYKAGADIFLALDCAASEFGNAKDGYRFEGRKVDSKEMISLYGQWAASYPIISIEDGLSENDWDGWASLTESLGKRCQIVGDDIFVTNQDYLKRGIESGVANAVLIKLNQIGTVSETLTTMRMAKVAGYSCIASHRSGETEDTFIADLAVGTDCGQIKTGSASRTDRIAKYNQLIRIEEELGGNARFGGRSVFGKYLGNPSR